MKRIEALALAISHANRVLEPDSEAFQTLNPGLLHAYANEAQINDQGVRIFDTLQGGLRALIANLEAKCEGKAKSNGNPLSPKSTLLELCTTFRGVRPRIAIDYLQDALNDRAISEKTPISYFIEVS